MKKIFSLSILTGLLAMILLPLFLMAHASHMHDHGGISECISHCLESVEGFTQPYQLSSISTSTFTVAVIIFSKIYDYVITLTLLYLFLIFPPPNIFRHIKNYSYSLLRGIVISTT